MEIEFEGGFAGRLLFQGQLNEGKYSRLLEVKGILRSIDKRLMK